MGKYAMSFGTARPKRRTFEFNEQTLAEHDREIYAKTMPDTIYLCYCMYAATMMLGVRDRYGFGRKRLIKLFDGVQANVDELLGSEERYREVIEELKKKCHVQLSVGKPDGLTISEKDMYGILESLPHWKLRIEGHGEKAVFSGPSAARHFPSPAPVTSGKRYSFNEVTMRAHDDEITASTTPNGIYMANFILSAAFLKALHDGFGFGMRRLAEAFGQTQKAFDSVVSGHLNYVDMCAVLESECGIRFVIDREDGLTVDAGSIFRAVSHTTIGHFRNIKPARQGLSLRAMRELAGNENI